MDNRRIILDVCKLPANNPTVRLGQGDTNAELTVELRNHGEPLDLTGVTASLAFAFGPERHLVPGTVSGSAATFALDASILRPGATDNAYAILELGNMRLSTSRFRMEVLESVEVNL